MKIESSNIGLTSQHASSRQVTVEESLRAWIGQQRPDFENRASKNNSTAAQLQLTVATVSAAGKQAAASAQSAANTQTAAEAQNATDQSDNDPRMLLLISLIEALTGRRIKLFNPNDMKVSDAAQAQAQQAAAAL